MQQTNHCIENTEHILFVGELAVDAMKSGKTHKTWRFWTNHDGCRFVVVFLFYYVDGKTSCFENKSEINREKKRNSWTANVLSVANCESIVWRNAQAIKAQRMQKWHKEWVSHTTFTTFDTFGDLLLFKWLRVAPSIGTNDAKLKGKEKKNATNDWKSELFSLLNSRRQNKI